MTTSPSVYARILSAIAAGSLGAACGGSTDTTGDETQQQEHGGSGGETVTPAGGSTSTGGAKPEGGAGPSVGGAVVGGSGGTDPSMGGAVIAGGSGGAGPAGGSGGAAPSWPGLACNVQPTTSCYTNAEMLNAVRYPYTGGGEWVPVDAAAPVPRTDEEVAALFLANGCLPPDLLHDGCCNPAAAGPVIQGDSCCYAFCSEMCCGRPLVVDGALRVAAAVTRSDWSEVLDAAGVVRAPESLRTAIGEAWLRDALFEHASVASFSRFALDLMAVGAPPELVAEAHRAALDEIAHARLCFALAARYGAGAVGPAALDVRGATVAPDLGSAVVAAIHEGCVGETIAALAADAQRDRATDPEVRRALTIIAEDEARHSALAYRFVAWALATHPELRPLVASAFDDAIRGAAFGGEERLTDAERALFGAAGRLDPAELRSLAQAACGELLPSARDALLAVKPRPGSGVAWSAVC